MKKNNREEKRVIAFSKLNYCFYKASLHSNVFVLQFCFSNKLIINLSIIYFRI